MQKCQCAEVPAYLKAIQIRLDIKNGFDSILYEWFERDKVPALRKAIAENLAKMPEIFQPILKRFYFNAINLQFKIDELKSAHTCYL